MERYAAIKNDFIEGYIATLKNVSGILLKKEQVAKCAYRVHIFHDP